MKKTRMVLMLSVLACSISSLAFAQTQSTPYTLEQCLDRALENNLRIRQGELDLATADIAQRESKAQVLPSLNASVSGSRVVGRSINPFTNQIVEEPFTQNTLSATANWTLFDGLNNYYSIKQSNVDQQAGQYALEQTRNDVMLDVVGLYTDVLFNQELVKAAEAALATAGKQLEQSKVQVEAGQVPYANQLQAELQLANSETDLINRRNSLALSILRLKQALMIPADEPFSIDIPSLPDPGDFQVEGTASEVYAQAVASLPTIKAADARVESAVYGVKAAQSGWFPTLSLQGRLGTSYSSLAPEVIPVIGSENVSVFAPVGFVGGTGDTVFSEQTIPSEFQQNNYFNQLSFNQNRSVGLVLSIPVFNNFRVQANVDRSKIALERARYTAIDTRNNLRQNIEQAYQNVVAAKQTYRARQNQIASLREVFRNTEQRFNLGAANSVEYAQSRNDLVQGEADFIRAKYDYIFKIKILEFYQGKSLTF